MGEVFAGRYELVDPIGRGGVGAVWRAWDHRRRRYVAAKVLQQSDAHTLLRFVREQALRIEHPHVLAPASWAADDDKVLFTMDVVSGGSLAHVIGDYGPLPPRFVCLLLDQLLSGLSTVHAEGVVHRDIKPANILMEATGTDRPHLRLSDFGISMRKGEPRLTETNYVVGTPGYFAPEQMMGAEPDFPADLFAVGLVALYLLQGQKPDSKALIEYFATHGTPSAPQGVPEPLWQVLAGLLQPDPHARFRTATGARKALTAAIEMLPEAGPGDEPVEVFDQIGPLPAGYGPDGPVGTGAPETPGNGPQTPAQAVGGTIPAPQPPQETYAPQGPGQQLYPQPQGTPVQQPYTPPSSMSETGSFHLAPPPQPPAPHPHPAQPRTPSAPLPGHPAYPYAAADAARGLAQAATAAVPYGAAATRAHTARNPQVPSDAAPQPSSTKRPGPPPKVAVPVLVVALICFAVGIWALTQA
ncbi:serine/threonine protein kinase [Streptomyces sp. NPDC002911]